MRYGKYVWGYYNVDDVLYVLGNQWKRDINSVRISPVQFLYDWELGLSGEKQEFVSQRFHFWLFTHATESVYAVTRPMLWGRWL